MLLRSRKLNLVPIFSLILLEFIKVDQAKQSLVEKKNENELVIQEFNTLEEGASIFKLVGPILAKQDLAEAKTNV